MSYNRIHVVVNDVVDKVRSERKTERPEAVARFVEDARWLGMDESGKSVDREIKKIVDPSKKSAPEISES